MRRRAATQILVGAGGALELRPWVLANAGVRRRPRVPTLAAACDLLRIAQFVQHFAQVLAWEL